MEERFHFKKKYGQNFLKDENILEKIVKCANLNQDAIVIEVGPGKGVLTKKIARYAKQVICFEIDTELKTYLEENLQEYSNVSVIYEDFMKADIMKYLEEDNIENLYFVSNVPYYITTPILMKLMSLPFSFQKIVMMVQKEVGNRFSSKKGNKEYSSISVYLNYFFDVKKEFEVSRNCFIPSPNVDSVVISLTPKKEKLFVENLDFFFQLVRDSFQFKRKTLRNNLKKYDLLKIEKVLSNYQYDLNVRAEELDTKIFVEIANNLFQK